MLVGIYHFLGLEPVALGDATRGETSWGGASQPSRWPPTKPAAQVRRHSVVVLALRTAGRGRSATEGACPDPVALDEVRVGQRVDQVAGDIVAVERRLEAPNVRDVTPNRSPATAVPLGTPRHGGDVVSGRVERGGDNRPTIPVAPLTRNVTCAPSRLGGRASLSDYRRKHSQLL
jgi:hypothetical protein